VRSDLHIKKTMNSKNKVKSQTPKPRHIPQRSCIACREKKDKRDLVRLVYSSKIVEIDSKGEKTGRGAYLCPKYECWDIGLRKNRLDQALRTNLSLENRQALLEYGKSLTKKEVVDR
jgi:predicted RNA-binding protein YlxR (DUF448 family)